VSDLYGCGPEFATKEVLPMFDREQIAERGRRRKKSRKH
jgi:hypothetical protein